MAGAETTSDAHDRRLHLESQGRDLATRLGIDIAAFGVGSNLHWAGTLMKLHFERAALRGLELTLTDFVTLWTVEVGGEMEAGDVAREAGLPKSSFSAVAKRLEQRGLLVRRPHPTDGRSWLLATTDEGSGLVERAFKAVNAESVRMTSSLSDRQIETLARLLRQVADQLEDLSSDDAPASQR